MNTGSTLAPGKGTAWYKPRVIYFFLFDMALLAFLVVFDLATGQFGLWDYSFLAFLVLCGFLIRLFGGKRSVSMRLY